MQDDAGSDLGRKSGGLGTDATGRVRESVEQPTGRQDDEWV